MKTAGINKNNPKIIITGIRIDIASDNAGAIKTEQMTTIANNTILNNHFFCFVFMF